MELFKRYHVERPSDPRSPFEIRSSPRVATSMPAEIRLAGESEALSCRLRDIGSGGVCLQTPSPFAYESLKSVTIHLSDSPLTLDAAGAWQREATLEQAMLTGAKFVKVGRNEARRVRKFVEQSANELTEFLQCRSQFYGIEIDEAFDIAIASRLREARAGTWIFTEGRTRPGVDSLFIVMSGTVLLVATVASEGDTEIERVLPGGVFGGVSLVSGSAPPLSAVAESDVTLLEIDEQVFGYLERAKPFVARRLTRTIVLRQAGHLRSLVSYLMEQGKC